MLHELNESIVPDVVQLVLSKVVGKGDDLVAPTVLESDLWSVVMMVVDWVAWMVQLTGFGLVI